MKCHIQFSGKNKKNITNPLSAESAHRVVSIKNTFKVLVLNYCIYPKYWDTLFKYHT